MALTLCHECGNDMSTEAKACPKCGAPANAIRQRLAEQRVREGKPAQFSAAEQATQKRQAETFTAIFSLALLGGVLAWFFWPEDPKVKAAKEARRAAEQHESTVKAVAVGLLRASLKDPESLQLGTVVTAKQGKWDVVCGEFNAKNGFGGYTGTQRFAYRTNGDFATTENNPSGYLGAFLDMCFPGRR